MTTLDTTIPNTITPPAGKKFKFIIIDPYGSGTAAELAYAVFNDDGTVMYSDVSYLTFTTLTSTSVTISRGASANAHIIYGVEYVPSGGTTPSFEYLGSQNGSINLTATVNVGDYIIHCASSATNGLAYTGMDLIYEYAGVFRSGGVQVRFTCFIATSTTITVNSQSTGGGLVFKMTF